jgi:hypothetical protein
VNSAPVLEPGGNVLVIDNSVLIFGHTVMRLSRVSHSG